MEQIRFSVHMTPAACASSSGHLQVSLNRAAAEARENGSNN